MWHYNVSHRQLTLRAVKSPQPGGPDTRVDIRFFNVNTMALPTILSSVISVEPQPRHFDLAMHIGMSFVPGYRLFVISEDPVGWVEAGDAAWCEDDGEYDEPSMFDIWHGPPRAAPR